ncbi:MAG: histidinol-phosphate transaminase [bacterium]|nr:histidinol-phosphate transaminase [bacterium]
MSWEDNIRRVEPYTPGEQTKNPDIIKLNTNECPYPPSPKVVQMAREMDIEKLRLYPDPKVTDLNEAWAEYYHLQPDQVFSGVGSDDVLAIAFLTFFYGKKPILFPDITYSFYDVWADLFRIPFVTKALDEHFKLRKEDYFGENGGVIIANPNAPTGEEADLAEIEDIIRHNPDSVVIVDEAYVDFGAASAVSLIDKYENLLVVQTFSKAWALAGLRIGFAMGNKKLIRYMNDVKFSFNSYTMNTTAIRLGTAAIQDVAYMHKIVTDTVKTRERVKPLLRELGFTLGDSKSNFVFVSHRSVPASELFQMLREHDILVRYFSKPERINNYLRISIGTDEQMDRLLEVLKKYLENK